MRGETSSALRFAILSLAGGGGRLRGRGRRRFGAAVGVGWSPRLAGEEWDEEHESKRHMLNMRLPPAEEKALEV
ncbi:MAG: hypothetical protein A2V77_03065 [Anaeromyxobacter sp. RBG_16_69_14]|nr:MAG: hypothetical protein A2V77_03065 [Anaeromyxobacter sp. RBG_16_69_14]